MVRSRLRKRSFYVGEESPNSNPYSTGRQRGKDPAAGSDENLLDRIYRTVALVCCDNGMLGIAFIVILTVRHALGRYLFNAPVTGNIAISNFAVVISIFLCMAYTMQQDGHITACW